MFHHIISNHREAVANLKDKAVNEYENALKMPRKKKKVAKKSALLLLFNIACYGETLLDF